MLNNNLEISGNLVETGGDDKTYSTETNHDTIPVNESPNSLPALIEEVSPFEAPSTEDDTLTQADILDLIEKNDKDALFELIKSEQVVVMTAATVNDFIETKEDLYAFFDIWNKANFAFSNMIQAHEKEARNITGFVSEIINIIATIAKTKESEATSEDKGFLSLFGKAKALGELQSLIKRGMELNRKYEVIQSFKILQQGFDTSVFEGLDMEHFRLIAEKYNLDITIVEVIMLFVPQKPKNPEQE